MQSQSCTNLSGKLFYCSLSRPLPKGKLQHSAFEGEFSKQFIPWAPYTYCIHQLTVMKVHLSQPIVLSSADDSAWENKHHKQPTKKTRNKINSLISWRESPNPSHICQPLFQQATIINPLLTSFQETNLPPPPPSKKKIKEKNAAILLQIPSSKSQAEPRFAEYKIILPQQDALGKGV